MSTTKPVDLPSNLVSIRDAAIDYAIGRVKMLPENIDTLNEWFEEGGDGWDALVDQGSFEDLAVDITSLAYNLFNDQELEAWEGIDPADITDASRVKFARARIENVFGEDEFLVKSVCAALLENDAGETAVIGAILESHGQGGMGVEFLGFFKTFGDFQEDIRKSEGLVLLDDCPKLSDEHIIKLWDKETQRECLHKIPYTINSGLERATKIRGFLESKMDQKDIASAKNMAGLI